METRWFTDAAEHGPAAVAPTFTAVESAAFQDLLSFACDPANAEMELLHCIDAAGTRVHASSKGLKAAPVTDEMRAVMANGAVRHWHNHPSRDSLSSHDWICAGASAETEVLALNVHGSIFVGRIVDWDDRLYPLLAWLPRLATDLELCMDGLGRERGLDFGLRVELATKTGHVLNLALARTMPVRYAFRLLRRDEAAMRHCEELGIPSHGVDFAEDAIRRFLARLPERAVDERTPPGRA